MTISGSSLSEHRAGLKSMVQQGNYDRVVMHGYSNAPIHPKRAADFRRAVRESANYVRAQGAEPMLLMTWAYKGRPEMTKQLAEAYEDIAGEMGLAVVPVGLAFADVEHSEADIELYSPDVSHFSEEGEVEYRSTLKHPSLAGTYLSACVVYKTLYGLSPVGLPYHAGLEPSVAERLQQVADRIVDEYLETSSQSQTPE